RGRRAADLQLDRPRFGHPSREDLPCDDEAAAAFEVIVEAQRTAAGARVAAEDELRLARGDRIPAGDVAKIVESFIRHGSSGPLDDEIVATVPERLDER